LLCECDEELVPLADKINRKKKIVKTTSDKRLSMINICALIVELILVLVLYLISSALGYLVIFLLVAAAIMSIASFGISISGLRRLKGLTKVVSVGLLVVSGIALIYVLYIVYEVGWSISHIYYNF